MTETMQLDTIVERVDVEADTYDAIGIDRANGNLFLVHGRHDRPGVPASIPRPAYTNTAA